MISVLSIYVGAFGAIVLDNIKRLMAYSTIGSIGYVLLALSAGSQEALGGESRCKGAVCSLGDDGGKGAFGGGGEGPRGSG